ncbi:MAG TPA: transglutaminase family protein [Chthoniobacteraceae bacterium]|jgi:transglutaminase-like putative cysteine protease|nr:transglutaminase family protein [Chthoniobacteraceae bacterium]
MEFEITHVTTYKYGHSAGEAYGEARLTPPNLPSQRVLSHKITIEPEVQCSSYEDYYGNRVDFFSVPFRHDQLIVKNSAIVATAPPVRVEASLTLSIQEARQVLNSRLAEIFHFTQPTPVIEITRESVQWAKKYLRGSMPLGASLQALTEAIYAEFKYKSGATENTTPLAEIWRKKVGVCQDFAHIGLSILRAAGLPARYVCGYIETDPPRNPDGTVRRLTGWIATHAWIEVLAPGMVWVALDPTNCQWVDERYVAVSFGRDYKDAAPLRGTFKGSGGQEMKVRVRMKRRNGKARP